MTDCYVSVNSNRIGNDMERIEVSINNIQNQMVNFQNEVIALCSSWQGDASSAFMQTVNEDFQLLNELMSELVDFNRYLGEAQTEYVNCENDVSVRIAAITV